jgi:uncharacterized protein YeaO (DUF488 family)
MIKTKSVDSPTDPKSDGLRILAARFRGRGLPASRYDVWMPNLGPSETLLKSFLAEEISWPEFGRRYGRELLEDGSIDARNATIKNHGQNSPCGSCRNSAAAAPSPSSVTAPRTNRTATGIC